MKLLVPAVLWALWLFSGCGDSGAAQSCQSTCECTRTDAPIKCAGEWICGQAKTCEYVCQNTCASLPYTCPEEAPCNGSLCSARGACR